MSFSKISEFRSHRCRYGNTRSRQSKCIESFAQCSEEGPGGNGRFAVSVPAECDDRLVEQRMINARRLQMSFFDFAPDRIERHDRQAKAHGGIAFGEFD